MMSNKKIIVSDAMAILFKDQCMGETSGHMAMIPNNPVLFGICTAHNIKTDKDFSDFLKQVAEKLVNPDRPVHFRLNTGE